MPRQINLDAARAARAEQRAASGVEPITVAVGDSVYRLPDEMPVAVLEAAARLDAIDDEHAGEVPQLVTECVSHLVGAEVYAELIAVHHLTLEDLRDLLGAVATEYGLSLGESPASAPSS